MSPNSAVSGNPSREEIARRAYEIYENEGRPEGRCLEHWLKAEVSLVREREQRGRRSWGGEAIAAGGAVKQRR
jgi:hypothetical protein